MLGLMCAGAEMCVRLSVGSPCQLFGSVVTAGCWLPSTCNLAQPAQSTAARKSLLSACVITGDHHPLGPAHSAIPHSASLQPLAMYSSLRGGMDNPASNS